MYSILVFILMLYVIYFQVIERRGQKTPLYINLMEQDAYAGIGFDPAAINALPNLEGGQESGTGMIWRKFPPDIPRRIVNAGLPGLPWRHYLSPLSKKPMEFTILIPFDMDAASMALLNDVSSIPGIFLAYIGDNWEIFFNGRLIRSELHLGEDGWIQSGRAWRSVFFPVDKTLFHAGRNVLAFRIFGDPTYGVSGFYYHSPYYIEDYSVIEYMHNDTLIIIVCSIYLFMGLYHLLLYTGLRRESYNLYYAFFLIILGFYTLARNRFINQIIPDSNIAVRIEYLCLFMLPAAFFTFVEVLWKQRLSRPTKIYSTFCFLLSILQLIFSNQFGDELLPIWGSSLIAFFLCFFFFPIICGKIKNHERRGRNKEKKNLNDFLKYAVRALVENPSGNIMIGIGVAFICGTIDIADAIFFHNSIQTFIYGCFFFTAGTAFTLSSRFSEIYYQLDQAKTDMENLNVKLEATVRERTLELEEQTRIAESASRTKSEFLARMSHEIRTPMNAIIGMSQLVLREKLGPQAREYVNNIRHAGDNLLSIINDILDISKIESGKMDIIPTEYRLASLINDVLSIIRTRLDEKPLLFVTKIDGSLPRLFYGDEVRIRQVLLNLLSNAVKYTRKGHIVLTIRGEKIAEKRRMILYFEVSDTGIGIKSKNLERLFGNFTQFDVKQNREIEGTGLGLAISRNLCRLMGGDITVQSVYGEGSTFSAFLPQRIVHGEPFALVDNPQTKTVLVYEKRPVYIESLVFTINSLKVNCFLAQSREEFIDFIEEGGYQFVFTSSALYPEVQEILKEHKILIAPAVFAEHGEVFRPDIHVLSMPVHPAAVANILNGKMGDIAYTQARNSWIRFTAPDARILIVDDIATNLDVATGLLAPYKIQTDRSFGGMESLKLVRENRYDMVLMDHMMPDMDGIEAVEEIRKYEGDYFKKLPIIALTANAVSGMKEMFLEKGFNDYLSNPIEIPKLDEIIGKWIPEEKQLKEAVSPSNTIMEGELFGGERDFPLSLLPIQGVDIFRGITMTGGTEEGYRKVLAQFCKDIKGRLPVFSEVPEEEDLSFFAVQAHALKSAAGTIGATDIAVEAAQLEAAGKSGDIDAIRDTLPFFYEGISILAKRIEEALSEPYETEEPEGARGDQTDPRYLAGLEDLRRELEAKDIKEIDRILGELEKLTGNEKSREILADISDQVLMSEYAGALDIVHKLIEKNNHGKQGA
jgi:signal transduction histidine kinase/CheY-like chemotaxis protein